MNFETLLSNAGNVAARAILRAALPSMPREHLARTLRRLRPIEERYTTPPDSTVGTNVTARNVLNIEPDTFTVRVNGVTVGDK